MRFKKTHVLRMLHIFLCSCKPIRLVKHRQIERKEGVMVFLPCSFGLAMSYRNLNHILYVFIWFVIVILESLWHIVLVQRVSHFLFLNLKAYRPFTIGVPMLQQNFKSISYFYTWFANIISEP